MCIIFVIAASWLLGWWTAFVMVNKSWKNDLKAALFGWLVKRVGKLD
jgi:hypothetical protein